ncbi:MAG: hypothetical protein L0H29_01670, partial [Sinobacteraceae bacterium]|nr:hypothetical protein [Nevskiaceae bacterium]
AIADGTYMSPEDYEAVRHALATAIPSSVGADHREALKSRIKYGNELSLRKRINGLAGYLQKTNQLTSTTIGNDHPRHAN